MFGIKKKLSALIPSDARAHLQNVFTVEWEGGNKTVLVEVPNADHPSEVEMSGMGGTYGRLADDDEDDMYSLPAQQARKSSHKSSSYTNKSKVLPRITHQQKYGDFYDKYGSKSGNDGNHYGHTRSNTNSFGGDCQASPQTSSSSTQTISPYSSASPQFNSPSSFHPNTYHQNSSYGQGQSSRGKDGNSRTALRTDDVDDLLGGGDLGGIDYSARLNGTRDLSASVERGTNPFQ
ncbi:hypothetical protein CNBG_9049 [Cryptococcus deuterogattii R265]|uniref:Uncharacterized protein n=1 Tax=Cryptococcus deuterogattii (strain R265) TaxID=294750 RepID=A0A0L6DIE3_CRYD2|nr:hypothetical protein I310_00462 [Cryptococcus deuterogattii CA1014]KNX50192.1 hypothetical protein CNBG_9049 [Cryptococcus deuterogattii R265]